MYFSIAVKRNHNLGNLWKKDFRGSMTIIVWSMPAGRHSSGAVAEHLHVETTGTRHRETWGEEDKKEEEENANDE